MTTAYGKAKMLIDGDWVESASGQYMRTVNPANGEGVAEVPEGTREDVRLAVDAASRAKNAMAEMTLWERADLLRDIADHLAKHKDELAVICTQETGKPLHAEAVFEVEAAIAGFRTAAEQIKWLEGSAIPMQGKYKRAYNFYQPRGVYAVITPFNYPVNIPVEYIAPGLAAGNALVWIPAPGTAYTGIKLAEIIRNAGLPRGALNVITGKGNVVGDELIASPKVNGIGFTGSTPTGKMIAQRGAGKAMIMELGGNGPTIVMEDADIRKAAQAAATACFSNAGQACASTERILVHESVHDAFVEQLIAGAAALHAGDPLQEGTTLGPVQNEGVAQKMDRHIADAIAKGADLLYGGKRMDGFPSRLYYQPTILTRCSRDSMVNLEETFGPIAPILTFRTAEEALELSRQGEYSLAASVFTRSLRHASFFSEKLNHGIVNINDHSMYWEIHVPFGGAAGTNSGVGRIGGLQTIQAMSNLRTVIWDIS